jgi:chemotaxis protein methyltransferase CheR
MKSHRVGNEAYTRLRELLLTEIALDIGSDRQYLVESRLGHLVDKLGFSTLDEFIHHIVKTREAQLMSTVLEKMVTTETSFFRDQAVFDALRLVIPQLFERNRGTGLRFWSAAASSGQEAYSVAITVLERFPNLLGKITIVATDISREMVARIERGWYSSSEVQRGLTESQLARFFVADGFGFRVRPDLRAMVQPMQLNLVGPWPVLGRFDVILLRNVLIYFPVERKREVLNKMATRLSQGGYLVLGTGESLLGISERFQNCSIGQAVFYQLDPS